MRRSNATRSRRNVPSRRRGGFSWVIVIGALAALVGLPVAAWYFLRNDSAAGPAPIIYRVERGTFEHEVTERGDVESSNNVEVKCQVPSKNSQGTMIRWIIAEGTEVQEGDKLIELDDSALRSELTKQQIIVNNTKALVTQADSTFRTAEKAQEEYVNGTYEQERETILGEIAQAEENLRRAQQTLQYSKKLAERNYITPLQLKADVFAVTKGENDYNVAVKKLEVLEKFTFETKKIQLEADIETARVKLDSEQKSHELDKQTLADIEQQIAYCTMLAPSAGQVVYSNQSDWRGQSEFVVEPGAYVREQQTIIRLPDPTKMQVKAKINESRIDLIHTGLRATVQLDAFPDLELRGRIIKVDDYPLPGNSWMSSVKEYGTLVEIDEPPAGMRTGLTAQVKIHIERLADVVQVPVSAIIEHGGQHFCLVQQGEKLEPRQVEIGSSNDKYLVIRSGLESGELCVANPRKYRDQVALPEIVEKPDGDELIAEDESSSEESADGESESTDRPRRGRPDGELAQADRGASGGASAGAGDESGTASQERPRRGAGGGAPDPAAMFAGMDTDSDGKLSAAEMGSLPEQFRQGLLAGDTDSDGAVSRSEWDAVMAAFRARMQQAGAGGGAPAGGGGAAP